MYLIMYLRRMNLFWKGLRFRDTLAFAVNRLVSVAITAMATVIRGSLSQARKWREKSPSLSFPRFPFRLENRFFYHPKLHAWSDFLAWDWWLQHPIEWLEKVKPGSIGIDIGAHRGYWSLLAAYLMKGKGKIIALEPNETNFNFLLQNVGMNNYGKLITPMSIAAWKERIWLNMVHLFPEESPFHTFSGQVVSGEKGDILGVPVDELVRFMNLKSVDWIKIDVEERELEVIEGLRDTLATFRPHLYVEVHNTWDKLEQFLSEVGYTIAETIGERPGRGHVWAIPAE